MKKIKRQLNKVILFGMVTAVIFFSPLKPVFSSGWFTSAVDLTDPAENRRILSGNSDAFSIGSVGDSAVLTFMRQEYPGMEDSSGYTVFRFTYHFAYLNNEEIPVNAYIRFIPDITFLGEAAWDDSVYSILESVDPYSGDLIELPRLDFTNQDSACYYPCEMSPGEAFNLVYTFYVSDAVLPCFSYIEYGSLLHFEMVPTNNNASAIRWNVVFGENSVTAFDTTYYVENNRYNPYDIEWSASVLGVDETELFNEPVEETEIGNDDALGEVEETGEEAFESEEEAVDGEESQELKHNGETDESLDIEEPLEEIELDEETEFDDEIPSEEESETEENGSDGLDEAVSQETPDNTLASGEEDLSDLTSDGDKVADGAISENDDEAAGDGDAADSALLDSALPEFRRFGSLMR